MKNRKYKLTFIYVALLCSAVTSMHTIKANEGIQLKNKNIVLNENNSEKTVTVNLQWKDYFKKLDHSKDEVQIKLLKSGQQYQDIIKLTNDKWTNTWKINAEEWRKNYWSVEVVKNKKGYTTQFDYNQETNTYTIINHQVEDNAVSISLNWEDDGMVDHSKHKVKVRLYKDTEPFGDVIELSQNKKEHVWDLTDVEGIEKYKWNIEVVKNTKGYKEQIAFDDGNGIFTIVNQRIPGVEIEDDVEDNIEQEDVGNVESSTDDNNQESDKEVNDNVNGETNQDAPSDSEVDKVEESGKEDVIQEEVKQPETGKEESSEVTIPKVENEKTEMNDKENQEVSEGIKQPLDKVDEKQPELEKETSTVKEEKTEVNKGSEAVNVEETTVKQEDKSVSSNTKQEIKEEKKETQQVKQEQTKERESVKTSDQTNTTAWWVVAVSALLAMLHACKRKFCRK